MEKNLQTYLGKEMREIKFKVWDTWEKCWFDWFYIDPNDEINYLSRDGMEQDENRFILVQYTGLKDKNGDEIYEGDVIKGWYEGKYSDNDFKSKVWFDDGMFLVKCGKEYCPPLGELVYWKFEIIGNIYENPELLK